jgi:predicted O-methyltransferase YrrM
VLTDALNTGQVLDAADNPTPLHSNVSLDEAARLGALVARLAPAVTIEIGCAHGISTLAIGQSVAASGGTHHVIDPYQHREYGGIGFANVERAGLSASVRCYANFPENVVPGLPRASFAFIDASHLFDLSVLDFVLVDKRLTVGGIIGFHDLWMPSLRTLLRYILTNREYEVVDAGPGTESARTQFLLETHQASRARRRELAPSLPEMGVRDNLTFVRKLADDRREWTFHRPF